MLEYFGKHNIFYRTDNLKRIIFGGLEEDAINNFWSVINMFHLFESMRLGIHIVVEAFDVLEYGGDERLNKA